MHYVTHRSHHMERHMFSLTYPDALFVESALDPTKHEKLCVEILWPGRTGVHYVTRRSHWMQKHKFGIMCLDALFMESAPGPAEQEK
jgi:hypothetical protein